MYCLLSLPNALARCRLGEGKLTDGMISTVGAKGNPLLPKGLRSNPLLIHWCKEIGLLKVLLSRISNPHKLPDMILHPF